MKNKIQCFIFSKEIPREMWILLEEMYSQKQDVFRMTIYYETLAFDSYTVILYLP